jgi:hypothetical protein
MLEGLDAVPWSDLTHAYGTAADVPELIRAVTATDEATRRKAWHSLYGNLWHQGTIYEATARAVPFFIELAGSTSVPEREWVLGYLVNLAGGTSYNDVHQHSGLFADRRNTSEFQRQREQELGWVEATRAAVRRGRQVYAALLEDEAPPVRTTAAHLLSLFPQDAKEHAARLRAHVRAGELDERTRAWCVLSVGRLAKHDETAIPWLNGVLDGDASEAVRVAATLGLAWSKGRELPRTAYDLLARHASDPGPAAALFEHMPWDEGDEVMQSYCSEALGLIRDPDDDALDSLIAAMNRVADYQAIDIMRSLLSRVFFSEPMPRTTTIDRLSADQRTVLETIASSTKIWRDLSGRVLVTPVIEVMKEFALPPNVVRLQAFLDGRLTPQDAEWSKATLPPTQAGLELAARLRAQAEQWIRAQASKPGSDSGNTNEEDS